MKLYPAVTSGVLVDYFWFIDESGKKHIGIYNCLRRIELFYGEEGEIDFASGEGKGTQIYMVVPFLTSDNETRDADEHSDRGR